MAGRFLPQGFVDGGEQFFRSRQIEPFCLFERLIR